MSPSWKARVSAALAVVLLVVTGPGAASETTESPKDVVQGLHTTLLEVMRNANALRYTGRYDKLAPVVGESFHMRYMTSIVAGYHWRKFSPEQRDALTEAFRRMTTATYARRFDGYSGESFVLLSQEPGRRESVLVRSQIVKGDGDTVDLDYNLMKLDGKWGIVDVHPTGSISELATRRAEYSSVIRRDGLAALLRRIDDKIRSYAAEGS